MVCLWSSLGFALAQNPWQEAAESSAPATGERRIVPSSYRTVRLDLQALRPILDSAPELYSLAGQAEQFPELVVPGPDGALNRFRIAETPVMAPELQAKYPQIRCYTGYSADNSATRIKLDLTPWGFHAMVFSATQGTWFVDPMIHGNTEFYVVYSKKDYRSGKQESFWACDVPSPDGAQELGETKDHEHIPAQGADFQGDTRLRRYRLALSCTGEYSSFHGGNKPAVLAAMNTTMNRVNGVYETDFGVTMQIIANNDLLIYLDAGSDPFTNNNGGTMLGQNQTTCDNVVGNANYDIGHVFSTGGGGVAFLGVVCNNQNKARGVTGSGSPVGDPFDIDYVAHEIGHQFGGSHTFNGTQGSCSGNAAARVEPGSGTTIMAYAGICGAQNVAPNSEDFFHAYNIIEMGNYIYTGGGNTCPVKINTTNNNPTVNAGNDFVIPKSTPFQLTASGSDPDGEQLTYTWEQIDNANATSPPVATSTTGALFRSFKGTASPTRVFPRLVDIVNNANPTWEKLPGVARTMNFRVVARDNNLQAGCTDEDEALVTVAGNSGPFLVTQPNTNVTWNVGSTQTVTWDVANTTAAPVSCANVRILLSTDGGFTYPVVLSSSTANDGTEDIVVPNNLGNTCRVRVEGDGNIFFDISNANFKIEPAVLPTFFLNLDVSELTVCAGETGTINLALERILGFDTPASISVTGQPGASTVTVSPNPVGDNSASISISDLTPGMAGTYILVIDAVAGAESRQRIVELLVLPGAPSVATPTSPADGTSGTGSSTTVSWDITYASTCELEVATNPSFDSGSVVSSQTVAGLSATVTGLTNGSVYYWRVRGTNDCGTSLFSAVSAFQVGAADCDNVYASSDVPKAISPSAVSTVVSTLNVTENKPVEDVNVTLNINHTWVGDLIARLISPANDTVVLFDQPGIPGSDFGCDSDNMAVVLDDEAANDYAVLDGQCNGTPPAVSGIFKAAGLLAGQDGASAQGDWRLIVTDTYNEDGGAITAWSISLCFPELIDAAVLLNNSPLVVGNGGTAAPGTSNLELVLSGDAAQGIYTLLSLPTHGTLNLNGTTLSIGSTFTQADINSGALSYINNGDQSASDSFTFDVQDSANDHWLHNNLFNIIIAENNLSVTATQTQAVSCYNGNTGEITATAAGLDGNYTYSLNGGARQASNIFSGLSAGNYTVTVHGQFGLTASSQIIVLDNPAPVSASASTFLFDITVTAGGGTGVYEYSTDGANFQSNNVLTVSANGIYTVTVRDENGCTATTEVIVAVNQIIATATVTDNVTCAGGDNGSISVTAAGGEGPLSYALNGGTAQSSSVFTGLTAGAYTVQVSDSLGLSATTSEVIILEPAALQLTVASALNTVTATATGGTGALQYSINGVDYQNSGEFTGLVNGDYIVTVQDANGCTATTTVIVAIPILTLSLNFSASLFCAGDASGFITVLANGGIPPYSYSLNGGPEQTDNTFVGLQAGNYNITVRDAFNQELSYTVTITEPAPITGTATVVLNDVTLNISGGTPPYSFSNNNLQDLPNGSYSVTVTDGNGCSGIISFVVDVPPVTISATVTNVTCFGDSNGSISLFAAGGIPPYTLNGQPFVQGTAINNLAAGSYTVTILDSAGNESTSSFTVGSPAQLVVTATLNGNTITASATGGTGSYVFLLNGVAGIGNVFSNLPLGNYTVGVVDANGCAATINTPLVISSVVEPAEEWGLTVSPNPGTGLFVLTMNRAPEVLRAEVFDASGRMVRTLDFAPGGGTFSATVDIRELPDGNYILRLTDGKRWGGVRLSKAE